MTFFFQVEDAEENEQLRAALMIDEATCLLEECGFRKPTCMVTLSDRAALRSALVDYHCMIKVKSAMDQFIEGLQTLSVLDWIKKYSKPFVCLHLVVCS